ncbi:hypothetical protein NDU88_002750 [Pleurodeles waltl]|uniref:Uncharacterized protein n=1 Tax=Pleurodeles waltl TaxID=8319 RepID=A0AAV7UY56_PLEWA|nr:hypothetical protein NDU88_002750 [Pleurodeles waltl]
MRLDPGPIRCLQPGPAPRVPSPAGTWPQHSRPAGPSRCAGPDTQRYCASAITWPLSDLTADQASVGRAQMPPTRCLSPLGSQMTPQGPPAGHATQETERLPEPQAASRSLVPLSRARGMHHKRPTPGPATGTESGTRGFGGPQRESSARSAALPGEMHEKDPKPGRASRGDSHLAGRPGHAPQNI